MFILDSLLIGGLRFVLDKVATVVDSELNDETALRERLLAAEMRLDLGEISQEEFDALEAEILEQLREIRKQQQPESPAMASKDYKVTVDASLEGDEHR